ncbi:unnamed protein product [Mytilus edulis]|uniref:Uncharacterized protein n=1 Tax=Mytilus edulis TaxID=6550 RepID=A0A8S3RUS7_MYTED|nr:unnamed protein product [Mytilus edulis]
MIDNNTNTRYLLLLPDNHIALSSANCDIAQTYTTTLWCTILNYKYFRIWEEKRRFDQWKATKTAVIPAEQVQQTTNTQTEARDSVVGHVLTPTKYKGEPVGVVVNRDIVTSPYNPNKACHRLVYYTSTNDRGKRSRVDYEDGFDIDHPDLLRTPPHTSPVFNEQSKEAIQSAIQAARPDTPYQQDQRSRSKMKAKRPTDSSL